MAVIFDPPAVVRWAATLSKADRDSLIRQLRDIGRAKTLAEAMGDLPPNIDADSLTFDHSEGRLTDIRARDKGGGEFRWFARLKDHGWIAHAKGATEGFDLFRLKVDAWSAWVARLPSNINAPLPAWVEETPDLTPEEAGDEWMGGFAEG